MATDTKREEIQKKYAKTAENMDWLFVRALPGKERFKKYPFKTLYYAASDKFWNVSQNLQGRKVMSMKTFWGDRLDMLFPNYRSVLHHGIIDGHELGFEEYFVNKFSPQEIFFDIGANVGFYASMASALGATVHAFEPTPSTFKILSKNVPNATLVNKALSDSSGKVKFVDRGIADGTNSLMIDGDEQGLIEVETLTLDEYCRQTGVSPTIMKIDTEGADLKIIQGGQEVLKKYHPTIVMESVDDELINYICSLGYSVQTIGKNESAKFSCKVFTKK